LKTVVCIPTNPIGPWDNVDQKKAHVPMALIGRFLEAKREGYSNVTVYGSGKPERDFLFIGDIVKLFPYLLDKYDTSLGPINISSGKGTSIAELAETIANVVGYDGNIIFDTSKPDGQMIKILDNSRLVGFCKENEIEWEPKGLEETLSITVDWYQKRVLGE
jgi:GDP-L-fucose synthase